jgi:hypothetical protein
MKYILIYVADSSYQTIVSGTMFEVDRFNSIESAVEHNKTLPKNVQKQTIIIPYYDVD